MDIDVVKGGITLLAFVMAFYGLTSRERKTPYILVSVYSTVIFVLLLILLSLISDISISRCPSFSKICKRASELLLVVAVLFLVYRVWKIQNRHINFRDDNLIKNLPFIRKAKSIARLVRPKQIYEHTTVGIPKILLDKIIEKKIFSKEEFPICNKRNTNSEGTMLSLSIVSITSKWIDSDSKTIDLAKCFLKEGAFVQYTTSTRHPIEFIEALKKSWDIEYGNNACKSWAEVSKNIISVDAYTPHFGFTDSIYDIRTNDLGAKMGTSYIASNASYAGIHSSTAKAFNLIKKIHGAKMARQPTLVIYEGLYALIDLESIEQYRIFIRHLLPAEKMWGGMITYITETTIPNEEINLLKSYAEIFIYDRKEDIKNDS